MEISLARNSNRHDLSRISNFSFLFWMIDLLVIRSSEAVIAPSLKIECVARPLWAWFNPQILLPP